MCPFSYKCSSSSHGELLLDGFTSVTYSMDLHGHLIQVTPTDTFHLCCSKTNDRKHRFIMYQTRVYKWIFLLMKWHFPMSVLISAKMETFYCQPVSQFQVQHWKILTPLINWGTPPQKLTRIPQASVRPQAKVLPICPPHPNTIPTWCLPAHGTQVSFGP